MGLLSPFSSPSFEGTVRVPPGGGTRLGSHVHPSRGPHGLVQLTRRGSGGRQVQGAGGGRGSGHAASAGAGLLASGRRARPPERARTGPGSHTHTCSAGRASVCACACACMFTCHKRCSRMTAPTTMSPEPLALRSTHDFTAESPTVGDSALIGHWSFAPQRTMPVVSNDACWLAPQTCSPGTGNLHTHASHVSRVRVRTRAHTR